MVISGAATKLGPGPASALLCASAASFLRPAPRLGKLDPAEPAPLSSAFGAYLRTLSVHYSAAILERIVGH